MYIAVLVTITRSNNAGNIPENKTYESSLSATSVYEVTRVASASSIKREKKYKGEIIDAYTYNVSFRL